MQNNNNIPDWGEAKDVEFDEVEVEVIEKEDPRSFVYKPKITKTARDECVAGNNLPILAAVAAR